MKVKRVLGYAVACLLLYAGLLVVLRVFESRLIFFPEIPGRLSGEWHPHGLPIEDVWLRTSDGVQLHAWWIPAPGAEFTFVAFHGNAANIAKAAEELGISRPTLYDIMKKHGLYNDEFVKK